MPSGHDRMPMGPETFDAVELLGAARRTDTSGEDNSEGVYLFRNASCGTSARSP